MSTQIKKQRIKTGLTQEEAAVKLGIHPTTLNKYEGGSRTPSGKVLSAMSRLFNISMDTLIHDAIETDTGGEEAMYRFKFEKAQAEIIALHKEISSLKDALIKKPTPSKKKKQA